MLATCVTLVDVLQRHAAAFPDRRLYTCLADGESESGSLTYAQLDRAASALASVLRDAAAPGDRALLLYPVGLEYLVGFFGCLYAGLIAVPAYPPNKDGRSRDRILTIAADCEPRLVLTCAKLVSSIERAMSELGGDRIVHVLGTDGDIVSPTAHTLMPPAAPESVAFLQYTSASVGEAKGVRITHANLMANQAMIRHAMAHDDDAHFVSWLPPYHDMGLVGNLLHPLYLGTSCVFMPPMAFVQKPLRWLSAISTYRAHTSGAPNFAYDLCVKKIDPAREAALDLSRWRVAYCGAETIDAQVAERFCAHFAPWGFRRTSFYPCYGLAEATLMVSGRDPRGTVRIVEAEPDLLERGTYRPAPSGCGRRLVGCGQAPPDAEIAIVDPDIHTSRPDREIGEIWAKGAHIAAGYWNRPDVSREVLEARLDGHAGAWLRTGDLGALIDGELFVVGRIKEVIIHRGRNLYPTDLERVVETWAGELVAGSAALAVPSDRTEDVAIVLEATRAFAPESADRLGESIAWEIYRAFEVWPARLVFVKKGTIPRTSSGKKQRLLCARLLRRGELDALAEWRGGSPEDAWAVEPHEGTTRWLGGLIAKATGVAIERLLDETGQPPAFGLDSIRIVELAHHIERARGVALPISLFYEATSLDALARELERRARERARSDEDAAARSGDRDAESPLPSSSTMDVTSGQEAIWLSQQIDSASPAFHLRWALRVAGALEPDRLRDAVRTVVSRHEVLRCVFPLSADAHVSGRVLPDGVVDYAFVNHAAEPLEAWAERECDRPFRIEQDLLVRVRHGRDAAGDLVAFALHHLIADLWSCALFADEVLEQYTTGVSWARSTSYRLYSSHVARVEAERDDCRRYWTDLLADAPLTDPVDAISAATSRMPGRRYDGASLTASLDAATTRALQASAAGHRVSRQVLLLSAHGIWWWSLAGLDDMLTGCLTAGRTRAAFARMQGLLANLFAIRFRISAETTVAQVIARTRDQVLGALDREDYPFRSIARAVRPSYEPGRAPLFQNMFVYQQLPGSPELARCVMELEQGPFTHRGLEIRGVTLPARSARYDFTLYCAEVESGLAFRAVYATGRFEHAQVAHLLDQFLTLVRRIPQVSPDVPVGDLVTACEPAL